MKLRTDVKSYFVLRFNIPRFVCTPFFLGPHDTLPCVLITTISCIVCVKEFMSVKLYHDTYKINTALSLKFVYTAQLYCGLSNTRVGLLSANVY